MESDFICPRCRSPLVRRSEDEQHCVEDDLVFRCVDNVWRFLLPERQAHYEPFTNDYQTIRRAEDRISDDPAYFQRLPFEDISQRRVADWRIRAISYQTMLKKIIRPHERADLRLNILDMGAGNCWLSYRLAQRGHQLTAVDLLVNEWDGLGVHRYYPLTFTLIQSEYDRLPLHNRGYDLIIFNASFHYSEDYVLTLREAMRCLNLQGQIVILDSPLYSDSHSGSQMVIEREDQFEAAYGFKSDALRSENFLTEARLKVLEDELSIRWRRYQPYYGFRWLIRPLMAVLRQQRQPARFVVLAASRR